MEKCGRLYLDMDIMTLKVCNGETFRNFLVYGNDRMEEISNGAMHFERGNWRGVDHSKFWCANAKIFCVNLRNLRKFCLIFVKFAYFMQGFSFFVYKICAFCINFAYFAYNLRVLGKVYEHFLSGQSLWHWLPGKTIQLIAKEYYPEAYAYNGPSDPMQSVK